MMTISWQNCWHNLLWRNRLLVANHFCVRVIRIFEDPKFFAWAGGMWLLQHQKTHKCHASFSTSTDSSPMAVKSRIQMCGKRDKWRWSPDSPFHCRLFAIAAVGGSNLHGSPRLPKKIAANANICVFVLTSSSFRHTKQESYHLHPFGKSLFCQFVAGKLSTLVAPGSASVYFRQSAKPLCAKKQHIFEA